MWPNCKVAKTKTKKTLDISNRQFGVDNLSDFLSLHINNLKVAPTIFRKSNPQFLCLIYVNNSIYEKKIAIL